MIDDSEHETAEYINRKLCVSVYEILFSISMLMQNCESMNSINYGVSYLN